MNQQMQYRPVAMEFLVADSLPALETKVTEALTEGKMLHGDWKVMPNGSFAQAVCPAGWRPVPVPEMPQESGILVPRPAPPGRILG